MVSKSKSFARRSVGVRRRVDSTVGSVVRSGEDDQFERDSGESSAPGVPENGLSRPIAALRCPALRSVGAPNPMSTIDPTSSTRESPCDSTYERHPRFASILVGVFTSCSTLTSGTLPSNRNPTRLPTPNTQHPTPAAVFSHRPRPKGCQRSPIRSRRASTTRTKSSMSLKTRFTLVIA